jgi:PAS domain S-box-containing protein
MKNQNIYSLFELSPVPMWVFDVKTLRFIDVNIAATVNYGYSKEEFLSMTINDIRSEEEVRRIAAIVKENVLSGSFYKNTFRHRRKNGEEIAVEVASNLVTINDRPARLVLAMDITEKLKAEETILLNEKRFKALVQDGSDMITVIDRQFKYKYVSPASKVVFGIDPELFIGKDAFAYIHRDDLNQVQTEAASIWENKHIQLSPYRYRTASGSWLWVETKATNLFDDPAVEGIVCTSKDISQRIEYEKLLKQNIERYNIVSKATSDIIWDCNFKANTIIWNRAIKGILKYNRHKYTTYQWWKERIHPEDQQRVIKRLDEQLASGITKWSDEYRFLCGDGTYKFIFDRGFVLRDENEAPYRMIGAMQDISLKKEEENWSKLLESVVVNTTDGVLITDGDDRPRIIYVNDALVKMSGYSREELIGAFPDILHGSDVDQEELKKLKKAVGDRKPCKVELMNYTKTGESYCVSINLNPITENDGKLVRWVSIQRDVTDERRYVNEIEEQNKKLTEISWMQSHVVRAPLARIMSLVELLNNCPDSVSQKELLVYLNTSAHELDEIITQIANQT